MAENDLGAAQIEWWPWQAHILFKVSKSSKSTWCNKGKIQKTLAITLTASVGSNQVLQPMVTVEPCGIVTGLGGCPEA